MILVFLFVLGSSVGLVSATDHYLNYTVDIGATVPLYSGNSEYNATGLFAHKSGHKLSFSVSFYNSSGNFINSSSVDLNSKDIPFNTPYIGSVLVPNLAHWFTITYFSGVFNCSNSNEFYAVAPGKNKAYVANFANPDPDCWLPNLSFSTVVNNQLGGLKHYSLITTGGTVETIKE